MERLLARLLRISSTGPCGTPAGHRPEAPALNMLPRREEMTASCQVTFLQHSASASCLRRDLSQVLQHSHQTDSECLAVLLGSLNVSLLHSDMLPYVAHSYQFILQPLPVDVLEASALVGLAFRTLQTNSPAKLPGVALQRLPCAAS